MLFVGVDLATAVVVLWCWGVETRHVSTAVITNVTPQPIYNIQHTIQYTTYNTYMCRPVTSTIRMSLTVCTCLRNNHKYQFVTEGQSAKFYCLDDNFMQKIHLCSFIFSFAFINILVFTWSRCGFPSLEKHCIIDNLLGFLDSKSDHLSLFFIPEVINFYSLANMIYEQKWYVILHATLACTIKMINHRNCSNTV